MRDNKDNRPAANTPTVIAWLGRRRKKRNCDCEPNHVLWSDGLHVWAVRQYAQYKKMFDCFLLLFLFFSFDLPFLYLPYFILHISFPRAKGKERKEKKRSPLMLHRFQAQDGNPLPSIETQLDERTDTCFVLWDDIQQQIGSVHHLRQGHNVCCFAVNQEYRL